MPTAADAGTTTGHRTYGRTPSADRGRRGRRLRGAAATVPLYVLVAGIPTTQSREVVSATAPSTSPSSTTGPGSSQAEGAPGLAVVVRDGVPQLVDHAAGVIIGPVVRDADRAYGLEVRSAGERSFVLLLRGDGRELAGPPAGHRRTRR
jgi:hypothetical protein